MPKHLRYAIAAIGMLVELVAIAGLATGRLATAPAIALLVVGLLLSFAPVVARRDQHDPR